MAGYVSTSYAQPARSASVPGLQSYDPSQPSRRPSSPYCAPSGSLNAAQDGFFTPTYVSLSKYNGMSSSQQQQQQVAPSRVRAHIVTGRSPSATSSYVEMPVRQPKQETREFPADVADEEEADFVGIGRPSSIIEPGHRRQQHQSRPPSSFSGFRASQPSVREERTEVGSANENAGPATDKSQSTQRSGGSGNDDGGGTKSHKEPRLTTPRETGAQSRKGVERADDYSGHNDAYGKASETRMKAAGAPLSQSSTTTTIDSESAAARAASSGEVQADRRAPFIESHRADFTPRSSSLGAAATMAVDAGTGAEPDEEGEEQGRQTPMRLHRRVRSALSISSSQSHSQSYGQQHHQQQRPSIQYHQRESMSSSHSRSVSASTAISSLMSDHSGSFESGIVHGAVVASKPNRLRSFSDNLRRLSLYKKASEGHSASAAAATAAAPQASRQTNDARVASLGDSQDQDLNVANRTTSTDVSSRKSHLTLQSLAQNHLRSPSIPSAAVTPVLMFPGGVQSEILQSDNAVPSGTCSPLFGQSGTLINIDRSVDSASIRPATVINVRGWDVAKERGDSDSTIKHAQRASEVVSSSADAALLGSRSHDVYDVIASPTTPLATSRRPLSSLDAPQTASSLATPPSQHSVLIPSNFQSHPRHRSNSQTSAYARQRISTHGVPGKADLLQAASTDVDAVHVVSAENSIAIISSSNDPSAVIASIWQDSSVDNRPPPPRRRSRANSAGSAGRPLTAQSLASAAATVGSSAPPSAWASQSVRQTPAVSIEREQESAMTNNVAQPIVVAPATHTIVAAPAAVPPLTRASTSSTVSQRPTSPQWCNGWQEYGMANSAVQDVTPGWSSTQLTAEVVNAEESLTVSTSQGLQSGPTSQAHSSLPSQVSGGPSYTDLNVAVAPSGESDIPLQTFLNEEDMELIEEEGIVNDEAQLQQVRRRLVLQFTNLGAKWQGTNRPLSSRSRPTSSQTTEDSKSFSFADDMSFSMDGEGADRDSSMRLPISDKDLKERRKKRELLEARERDLSIEAWGKAEMAYAHVDIWTESRTGKWIIRGPAPDDAYPTERKEVPDPWAIPFDAKGIIRRKKLKSNVELTSSRTIIVCPDCQRAAAFNIAHNCATCQGTERVEITYLMQCVVRLAQFTPLMLPAALLMGAKQPHIKYIDTADPDHRTDILRDRALDGLQGAAARVVRVHNAEHGSRLLMGRVTIKRRGMLTVSVKSGKSKTRRVFDVEDGIDGKIVEVTHLLMPSSASMGPLGRHSALGFSRISLHASGAPMYSDKLMVPDMSGEMYDGVSVRSFSPARNGYPSQPHSASPNSGIFSALSNKRRLNRIASSPNLSQIANLKDRNSSVPPLPSHSPNALDYGAASGDVERFTSHQYYSQSQLQPQPHPQSKRSLKSIFRAKTGAQY